MLYDHDLGNVHNDTLLSAFVTAVAAVARAQQRRSLPLAPANFPPAVTFTYSNYAYASGFDNWLHGVESALSTPVVGAMDAQTHAAFVRRNVSVIRLYDSKAAPLSTRSLYIKAEVTHRLLAVGLKVIFSEMDVFWVNDPQLVEDPTLDLQCSEQGFGKDDLNLGFFLAQPTLAARSLFQRLARWPSSAHYIHCWDQALFDFAVRGKLDVLREECKHAVRDAPSRERIRRALRADDFQDEEAHDRQQLNSPVGSTQEFDAVRSRPLRWARISYELLPHPYKWHSKLPQQLPRAAIALGGVIAVHLWTSVSPVPPADRIACARMLGFWSLPSLEVSWRPNWRPARLEEIEGEVRTPPPHSAARLRVSPLLHTWEKSLPSETIFYREALVQLIARLRASRAALLRTFGHDPSAFASFPTFRPMQRHGRGTWPNGTKFAVTGSQRLAVHLNYSQPGGKCAAGMFTSWEHAGGSVTEASV
jgi:hypothetical protein